MKNCKSKLFNKTTYATYLLELQFQMAIDVAIQETINEEADPNTAFVSYPLPAIPEAECENLAAHQRLPSPKCSYLRMRLAELPALRELVIVVGAGSAAPIDALLLPDGVAVSLVAAPAAAPGSAAHKVDWGSGATF